MQTILRAAALLLFALATYGQASIVIRVTDTDGTLYTSKITGTPAAAGLETLKAWMATQTVPTSAIDQMPKPKYDDPAQVVKSQTVELLERLVDMGFVSSQTKADVDEIAAKTAALKAKRKQLFDAAKAEK